AEAGDAAARRAAATAAPHVSAEPPGPDRVAPQAAPQIAPQVAPVHVAPAPAPVPPAPVFSLSDTDRARLTTVLADLDACKRLLDEALAEPAATP
ncbi:hypothetical protein, partial [Rhodovulum sp. PH10]|uniref:hypothetical protein n=1 Tax=Rhodovulum sp. PH10 TaxID=1187851 RepID=UPI00058BAEA4